MARLRQPIKSKFLSLSLIMPPSSPSPRATALP